MVSLSTRPWPKPSWASRMLAASAKYVFFKEMQMHRRCIRYLKYLGFSLKKMYSSLQLRSFSEFNLSACKSNLSGSVHSHLPFWARNVTRPLSKKAWIHEAAKRYTWVFCQSPWEVSLSLDQCVLSMYMKWCLERQKSTVVPNTLTIYILLISNLITCEFIQENFCMHPLEKHIFFV